jgi:hypothetical protein
MAFREYDELRAASDEVKTPTFTSPFEVEPISVIHIRLLTSSTFGLRSWRACFRRATTWRSARGVGQGLQAEGAL